MPWMRFVSRDLTVLVFLFRLSFTGAHPVHSDTV
jgi:hypothetical protein